MDAQEDPRLINFGDRLHELERSAKVVRDRLEKLVDDAVEAMIELVEDDDTQQFLWRSGMMREHITVLMRNGRTTVYLTYDRESPQTRDLAEARIAHLTQAWLGKVSFGRTEEAPGTGYLHNLKFRMTHVERIPS